MANNNDTLRGFLWIATTVGLLVAVFAALILPITGDIEHVRDEIYALKEELVRQGIKEDMAQGDLATMKEALKTVRGLMAVQKENDERRLNILEAWISEHEARIRALDAAQWERIKALERITFGAPGPCSGPEEK